MATKLYFHDATTSQIGFLPFNTTTESLAYPIPDTLGSGAPTSRTMDTTIGVGQVSGTDTSLSQTGNQFAFMRRFLSPPLTAQTFGIGTWTLNGSGSTSPTGGKGHIWAYSLYVWRPTSGTVVGFISDSPNVSNTGLGTTAETNVSTSITGSNVTAHEGDVLVLEVWFCNAETVGTVATNTVYYDGTTESSTSNCASYLLAPTGVTLTFSNAVSKTFTIDANLVKRHTKTFTTDSYLKKVQIPPNIKWVQDATVQKSTGTSAASTSVFSTNPIVGNTIVVSAWVNGTTNLLPGNFSVTDNASNNVYTLAGFSNTFGIYAVIFYAPVTSTTSNFKPTLTVSGLSGTILITAQEYSGISPLPPVEQTLTGVGTLNSSGNTTVGNGSLSFTQGDLLVGVLGIAQLSNSITISLPTGYTEIDTARDDNSNDPSGTYNFGLGIYGLNLSSPDTSGWVVGASDLSDYAFVKVAFKPKSFSFNLDAFFKKTQVLSFTTDSYLRKTTLKTFTTDTLLKKLNTTLTFTTDTFLKSLSTQKNFTTDTLLKSLSTLKTFTTDTFLKKLNTIENFTSDLLLKKLNTLKTFTTDAQLIIPFTTNLETFTADALLNKTQSLSLTSDLLLKKLNSLKTFTTDTYLINSKSVSCTIDTLLTFATGNIIVCTGLGIEANILAQLSHNGEIAFGTDTHKLYVYYGGTIYTTPALT